MILFSCSLFSQVTFNQKFFEGRNGEEIIIPFSNESQGSTLSIELKVENTTVIFPEFVWDVTNAKQFFFLNQTHGVYQSRINNASDSLYIVATMLSGRDSITNILIKSEINNEESIDTLNIKNNYYDLTGTYTRFLYVENLFPNPQIRGGDINMTFYLDVDSSPKFSLYNISGKLIWDQRKYYKSGRSIFTIKEPDLPIGVYYLHIDTIVGSESKKIVIVR